MRARQKQRSSDDVLGIGGVAARDRDRSLALVRPGLDDIGTERTRRQRVDPHPGRVFPSEAPAHRVERRLRRPIGDNLGQRHQRAGRGDVDYAAALPVEHALAHLAGQTERPLEVEVHHRIEQLFGHLVARHPRAHAGVVHKNIHTSEGGIGLLYQPVALGPLADVRRYGQRLAAQRPHFLGHLLAVFQLAAGDDDVGAARREGLDHLVAQPARTAGDQRHLAGEIEQRVHHLPALPVSGRAFG